MITRSALFPSIDGARAGALLVLAFLCLPLFVGLNAEDLRNDESIYAYSVRRMLETGDWLTPRAIPFDGPFLEKPPLKTWMVAGLQHVGVLSRDERGLRALDAAFGGAAFLYVYALGVVLSGPVCGVVAVLILFLFGPLLLDHGVRSSNMESALLLAYCGGIYHYARVELLEPGRRRALHALAVGGYIALGFMTKFVAVAFLPIVCLLASAWRAGAWPRWRQSWRLWIAPAALATALCAPWFIYAWIHHGTLLWRVMLGQHVYTRFTGALDPDHLEPWSFYVSETWAEFARHGSHWAVAAGLVLLAVRAWRGRPWLARLVLLWAVVPVLLISMGTSKLFHYVYPFLPPLALAGGDAVASAVALIAGRRPAATATPASSASVSTPVATTPGLLRQVLLAAAVVALAVACWTVLEGRVAWRVAGASVMSNTSILKPLAAGAVLLWLAMSPPRALWRWAVLPLLVVLAVPVYEEAVARLRREDHPLRTLRDCALEVQRTSTDAEEAVYNAAQAHANHPYFYYLRALGPWKFAEHPVPADLRRGLVTGAQPTLVWRDDFPVVVSAIAGASDERQDLARTSAAEPWESTQTVLAGVASPDGVIVLLPGPYQACVASAVVAGWRAVGEGVARGGAQ